MLKDILKAFHLVDEEYNIQKFGDGLINHTWKITDLNNDPEFILQQINGQVFKSPDDIADNINRIGHYLSEHYPNYLFISPLPTTTGEYILKRGNDEYYRLFPYVKNSVTINTVQSAGQSFEAARQFALFTNVLQGFDNTSLHYTLPGFHDLTVRFAQFQQAAIAADKTRLLTANIIVDKAHQYSDIVKTHQDIIKNQLIPFRVIHHDTKISNVLFDDNNKGICVIDLDTVMPGYYISDVGDMMRTYLSPCNEEEQDLSKIEVREDFFAGIVKGYFSEMGSILTQTEKSLFVYAGKFMIYMQAIRFLADYLSNDAYYHTNYPDHNLVRAKNQFVLLEKYLESEATFQEIVNAYSKELLNPSVPP